MNPLAELDILIVDCQTTGATPALGAVLELGWGVVRKGTGAVDHLQAHWVTLPPGHRVGSTVRRLTGFDEEEVTDALSPNDAWERLRASTSFADRMPAAIHFAKFELAFLRDWSERFEPQTSFPLEAVCVHAIACRLYPDLPRRSLRALSGFLGYGLDPARRCLGHVEATAHIWQRLVVELATRGVHTWEQLGDWLTTPLPAAPRSRKRRYPLPAARYRSLPDAPGVYRLLRSNRDVLYIGKAGSLRKRVASHFSSVFTRTERALEMLTQVSDIEVTPTASALEAALLENECIKELEPPYNVQLIVEDARIWFIDRALDTVANEPSEVHRAGPLPSTFAARAFGAVERIAAGENATRTLRARAVEAPERWAPDEITFADGFAAFCERHGVAASRRDASAPETSRRRRSPDLVAVARKLILAARAEAARGKEESDAPEVEQDAASASELRVWDRDRVVRHLERGVMHGYQLLQRARWLCLLYDSIIVFRERQGENARALVVERGRLVDARDLEPGESLSTLDHRALASQADAPLGTKALAARKSTFDRHQYDRLRTLTTEVKRVLRDRGTAEVRLGRRLWLGGARLDALLAWV